ncbi:MAG TPA: hypoxanthine phosphoribosyltransferase [Bacteroidales bacterium]|nr:hypoxanthine phosphoribosyltransferase [Bacteroidales bacterium]
MKEIRILDKTFREFIPQEKILSSVEAMAARINSDMKGRDVVFLGILNGAFLFAADLFRRIEIDARISFVKLASYQGTKSTGSIKELIGWNEDISNKTVIVIEDIVDTGSTLERIVGELTIRKAAEIRIATMFLKPDVYKKNIQIHYVGMEIPDNFVVGYGLDYDGYGRNLPSVYSLIK